MIGVRIGGRISIPALLVVLAMYSFWDFARADNSPAKDVFAGAETKVYSDVCKSWSHLSNQLAGQRRGGQPGFFVRDKWALLVGINHFQDSSIKPVMVSRN